MPKLSRRTLFGIAGGGVALAGLGLAGLSGARSIDVARAILERLVGPFRMSDNDLQAVVDLTEKDGDLPVGVKGRILTLTETLKDGPKRVGFGRRFEDLERRLLTRFVMTTDYLEKRGGPNPEISFTGENLACSSPFAIRG